MTEIFDETWDGKSNEEKKIHLEKIKIENDFFIKNRESDLEREKFERDNKRNFFSPVTTSILAGILGLFGTTAGILLQGRANAQLERNKFEFSLVAKAFEAPDQSAASKYLKFIVESKILTDNNLQEKIALYVKTPQTIPTLQQTEKLEFDISAGTMNGLPPTATQEEVKRVFPFWTGDTPNGSDYNYGGGVFFIKNDFYFYTYNNFLNVRGSFTGKVSPAILNESKDVVHSTLGLPKKETPDGAYEYFESKFGCIQIQYSENHVTEISAFYTTIDEAMKIQGKY